MLIGRLDAREDLLLLVRRNAGFTAGFSITRHQELEAVANTLYAFADNLRRHIDDHGVKIPRRRDLRDAAAHETHANDANLVNP